MHRTTSHLACVLVVVAALAIATVAAAAPGIYGDNAGRVPRNWERVRDLDAKLDKATATYNVVIGLKRSNPDKLDALFHEVSDPRSPRYGEHLTNELMRQLVSPGPRVVGSVVAWLRSAGMRVIDVARHEDYVSCVGTAALIEKMLGVSFVAFRDKITSQVVHRAVGAYQLPAELASAIEVIGGISGFPIIKPKRNKNKKRMVDVGLGSKQTNVTPSLLYKVYNMTSFPATPSNKSNIQSFFQAQYQYVDPDDLKAFCKRYLPHIPADKCKIEKYIGYNNNTEPGGESSLDVQYLFATGHGTETWVYSYKSIDFCGDLMRWAKDVFSDASGDFPHVISMSYVSQRLPSMCLGPDVNRLSEDVKKMGTMGITVVIASGDQGSGETSREGYNYGLLSPSFPASIPYCTAVGSTTFKHGNSGEEVASNSFGSGGGFSFDYVALDYQTSFIDTFFQNQPNQPPMLSYNRSGRATPDVSTLGEGFQVIDQGTWAPESGTSASTPTFAGMVTLLNNVRLAGSGKHLGCINYLLYQNPDAFNDITGGNNDIADDGYGWYVTKGWDPVTGLGTPNFGKLVEVVKKLNARKQHKTKTSHNNAPRPKIEKGNGISTVWEATLHNTTYSNAFVTRKIIGQYVKEHAMYIVNDQNGTFYGINTTKGTIAWTRNIASCDEVDDTAGYAFGSDTFALSCSSKIFGVDVKTGVIKWTQDFSQNETTGNNLAAIGPDFTRVFAFGNSHVRVMELATGHVVWQRSTGIPGDFALSRYNAAVLTHNLTAWSSSTLHVFALNNGTEVRAKKFMSAKPLQNSLRLVGMGGNVVAVHEQKRDYPSNSFLYDFVNDKMILEFRRTHREISGMSVIDDCVVFGVSYTSADVSFARPVTPGYVARIDLNSSVTSYNQSFPKSLVIGPQMKLHDGTVFTTMQEVKNFSASAQYAIIPAHFVAVDVGTGEPLFDLRLPTTKNQLFTFDVHGNMIVPNLVGLAVVNATTGTPKQYSLNYQAFVDTSLAVLDNGLVLFAHEDKVVCAKYEV